MSGDRVECPACGGAGGGPFGRAGSAWDVETYECPRCEGTGRVQLPSSLPLTTAISTVAGLAKTTADPAQRPELPRKDAAKAGPKKAPAASPAATTRRAGKTGGRKSRG